MNPAPRAPLTLSSMKPDEMHEGTHAVTPAHSDASAMC